MSLLRRLDPPRKLYASFALLLCLSVGLSLWMLGQLGQMSALASGAGPKSASALQAQQALAGARLFAWLAIGVTAAAAAMLALWLRAQWERPLRQATAMARRIAAGDLSTHIGAPAAGDSGDLLESMQHMNDSLAAMIVKLRAGTEHIAGSAGQVAAGGLGLAACVEKQAAALDDSGAALAQLGAAARQGAADLQHAGALARSASELAAREAAAVADVADAMAAITGAARRCADFGSTIDAIARQAGEPVHGSARDLARRCALAAAQYRLLVDDVLNQASAGAMLADSAGRAVRDAAIPIARLGDAVAGIAAAAGHGSVLAHLRQGLAALDQAVRHSGELGEQCAASAAAMRDQAGGLSRASAAFVLGPEWGVRPPAIHLVSSNPRKIVRPRRDAASVTLVPVGSGAQPPARLARARGAAANRDADWQEF